MESESEDEDENGNSEYKNQYRQIYPSKRNTEEEYNQYIACAQKLYERFTGSYSKTKTEEKEKEKIKEAMKEQKQNVPKSRVHTNMASIQSPTKQMEAKPKEFTKWSDNQIQNERVTTEKVKKRPSLMSQERETTNASSFAHSNAVMLEPLQAGRNSALQVRKDDIEFAVNEPTLTSQSNNVSRKLSNMNVDSTRQFTPKTTN